MVLVLKKGASASEMQSIKDKLHKKSNKGIDLKKYAGTILLKDKPLNIQKQLRDEWR